MADLNVVPNRSRRQEHTTAVPKADAAAQLHGAGQVNSPDPVDTGEHDLIRRVQ